MAALSFCSGSPASRCQGATEMVGSSYPLWMGVPSGTPTIADLLIRVGFRLCGCSVFLSCVPFRQSEAATSGSLDPLLVLQA